MIKNKQNTLPFNSKPLVWVGYFAFGILVIAQIISIVMMFSRPFAIETSRAITVYAWLTAGTLLPPLVGYLSGYLMSLKTKFSDQRQLAGLAYALFSTVLTIAASFISFQFLVLPISWLPMHLAQFGYLIVALLVVMGLAASYMLKKNRPTPPVLYRPFLFSFTALVGVMAIGGSVMALAAIGDPISQRIASLLLTLSIPTILVFSWLLYPGRHQPGRVYRLLYTLVLTALYTVIVQSLMMTLVYIPWMTHTLSSITGVALATGTWLGLVHLSRRTIARNRR